MHIVRREIQNTLVSIINQYPERLRPLQIRHIDKVTHQIEISFLGLEPGATICDIGGGHGIFSVACAALGMKSILMDDFGDARSDEKDTLKQGVLENIHLEYGVKIIEQDVILEPFDFEPGSIDCTTCFDTMEHWHHSPKRLFHAIIEILPRGGRFIIGGPNCVNARKRITVPFGRGKWSPMKAWYEQPVFRSHVREPDISDYLYISRDLGLTDVKIKGRNWAGYRNERAWIRLATPLVDKILRLRPSLCSDIYLIGVKT